MHGGFEQVTAMFDEFEPDLFNEVTPPTLLFDLHQLLFGRSQHAFETHQSHVVQQVSPHRQRPPAHVLFLELNDGLTELGFPFALRLHVPLLRPNDPAQQRRG